MADWLFHPAVVLIKKPTRSEMNSHLKKKILFSDDWIRIGLYQRYRKKQEEKDTFVLIPTPMVQMTMEVNDRSNNFII